MRSIGRAALAMGMATSLLAGCSSGSGGASVAPPTPSAITSTAAATPGQTATGLSTDPPDRFDGRITLAGVRGVAVADLIRKLGAASQTHDDVSREFLPPADLVR